MPGAKKKSELRNKFLSTGQAWNRSKRVHVYTFLWERSRNEGGP